MCRIIRQRLMHLLHREALAEAKEAATSQEFAEMTAECTEDSEICEYHGSI